MKKLALAVLALAMFTPAKAFELTWNVNWQMPSDEVLPGYLDGTVPVPPEYWIGMAYGGVLDHQMHYHVDLPGGIPGGATWDELFDSSLHSWREITGFNLTWQSARLPELLNCGASDELRGTEINPVRFEKGCPWGGFGGAAGIEVRCPAGPCQAGGEDWLRADLGDIYRSNIVFWRLFDPQNSDFIHEQFAAGFLAHELGHTLGLGHTKNYSSVMAGGGIWKPDEKRLLIGHDDICGIAASLGEYERCSSYLGGAASNLPLGAEVDARFFGYASRDMGFSPHNAFGFRQHEIDIFATVMPLPEHRAGPI